MSETTVVCSKCGERVPKKKFCFECGAQLVSSINPQPTTSQGDKASTSGSDSASLEAIELANGQRTDVVDKQPMSSSTTTSRNPNEKANGMPSSYAEATAVGSRPSNKESQQDNQAGRVPNDEPTGSLGMVGSVTLMESNNNSSAATNVAGGANKANEKVAIFVLQ